MAKIGKDWLTMTDAAKYLGVSRRTFYRWKEKGIVKVYTLGPGIKRVKREDLDRLLEGQEGDANG